MNLKNFIREIPDWPKPGVNFKDITPLLENGEAFRCVVDKLAEPFLRGHPEPEGRRISREEQGDDPRVASFPRDSSVASLPQNDKVIDKIVGIDARGFLLASPVAYKLGCGLSIVRKKGKLPYKTVSQDYALEYASNIIEMHEDAIKKGERVVLIDDVLATGGTAAAAVDLIKKLGGEVVGIGFLINLKFLNGEEKLRGYKVYSLVEY